MIKLLNWNGCWRILLRQQSVLLPSVCNVRDAAKVRDIIEAAYQRELIADEDRKAANYTDELDTAMAMSRGLA